MLKLCGHPSLHIYSTRPIQSYHALPDLPIRAVGVLQELGFGVGFEANSIWVYFGRMQKLEMLLID